MGKILTASILATPIVYGLDKQRDIESAHKAIKESNKNTAKLQRLLVNEATLRVFSIGGKLKLRPK